LATTTSGALKALIESLGLGVAAYGDRAPQQTKRPYVVVIEEIALVPDPFEDGHATTGVETAQVDLYQDWRDLSSGKLLEDYTLAPRLKRGLHGARTALIGTAIVYVVRLVSSLRLLDEAGNEVHHTLTVEVWREL